MSISVVEVSGEKVKAMWDKRLIEIFYDICIKEILKGNRLGGDASLGWNPIKRYVDASDDWWESRLGTLIILNIFKLDQMFMRVVATGDKA
ncbi:hypothetical protein Gotur_006521 [Gossypium turneri]